MLFRGFTVVVFRKNSLKPLLLNLFSGLLNKFYEKSILLNAVFLCTKISSFSLRISYVNVHKAGVSFAKNLHCVKSSIFGVFLVRMRENTDQKNSEYKHFLHSVVHIRKFFYCSQGILKGKIHFCEECFTIFGKSCTRNYSVHSKKSSF